MVFMSNVGQCEHITQNCVVKFFQDELNYRYLGDWQNRDNHRNAEVKNNGLFKVFE
jgi:type I restriction enzyme R subunit